MNATRLSNHLEAARARAAARKRLPAWLALLMPFIALSCVFGLTVVLILGAPWLQRALHPLAQGTTPDGAAPLAIFFGAFVTAVAPGLALGNVVLWLAPPLRRILQANAQGAGGLSMGESMRGLAKVASFTVPLGLVVMLFAVR